jgi:hypothetical protein
MSMFPGPGANIYRNEAGEPIGWDYPSEPDLPYDYDDDRYEDRGLWDEDDDTDETEEPPPLTVDEETWEDQEDARIEVDPRE